MMLSKTFFGCYLSCFAGVAIIIFFCGQIIVFYFENMLNNSTVAVIIHLGCCYCLLIEIFVPIKKKNLQYFYVS